jgi:hypothetical protein
VEDDLKTLGVRRWREREVDREEWGIILKETVVKLGQGWGTCGLKATCGLLGP